jgi:hypothetical protein
MCRSVHVLFSDENLLPLLRLVCFERYIEFKHMTTTVTCNIYGTKHNPT